MNTNALTHASIDITGGFWQEKQKLVRSATVWNVYRRFAETGRFKAFLMDWKEGEPNRPHIFWDSDVAKWIEGVAYLCEGQREPELEAIVDRVVDCIERGRTTDGYFNIYYEMFELPNRFTVRGNHELYCAGHLIEAAIAYDRATGKGKFLSLMKDYAACIRREFIDKRSTPYKTPGHEEIELALIKLYDYTGDSQYLDMAMFFLNERGHESEEQKKIGQAGSPYIQDHLPVREQKTAVGHAVRAGYLYSAMADAARITDDGDMKAACLALWEDITRRKMYITGSIGSTANGETFEEAYCLPNDTAYAETCAAIALAFFARRMARLDSKSVYADVAETILYNGFLSGMSLDGKAFFYENAQEINLTARTAAAREGQNRRYPITQRVEVFGCSCCPPNIVRFIPSVADFMYRFTDSTVYIEQYMDSRADFGGFVLTQKTAYPTDGRIVLTLTGAARTLALRIPGWCRAWTVTKNGQPVSPAAENGYAVVSAADGDTVELNLVMRVRHMTADPRVVADRGLCALTYGPFVMCMEGTDNGGTLSGIRLCGQDCTVETDAAGLPRITHPAVRVQADGLYGDSFAAEPMNAVFVPYFTFANRGETDMKIWTEKQ